MHINMVKKGQLLLLLSFGALILIGMLLLLLPGILHHGRLSLADALFMSCSAVCLNGLATVPLTQFTFGGQLILLVLVQCGSIGIMSLSAAVMLMLGRNLSFSDTLMLNNLNDRFTLRGTENLTRMVLNYTLICEAAGALLMFPAFLIAGKGFFTSLWYSLFFSIASFCNSGLSLMPGSMANVGRFIQSISMIEMFLGGLGVYVIYDLHQKLRERHHRVRLHTRLVLSMAILLVITGTLLLWLLSRTDSETAMLKWFDALFLSVACRTTGYSTIDPGMLSPACQILLIVLMMIGGAPGSTAGGIKTTTVAVAFAALSSSFKGENNVIIGKRSVAMTCVLRAFTIIVMFVLLCAAGALGLNSFAPDVDSLKCFFEATSALSTTGLSTGTTTMDWEMPCKLFITLFMFAGRVGPLTILLFFAGREKQNKLRFPEEQIIVG